MSRARSDVLAVTRIAPIFASANWRTTHSGTLVAHSTTRSPCSTPRAMSPRAIVRASWSSARERVARPLRIDERLVVRERLREARQQVAER